MVADGVLSHINRSSCFCCSAMVKCFSEVLLPRTTSRTKHVAYKNSHRSASPPFFLLTSSYHSNILRQTPGFGLLNHHKPG